jgi:hypothetical protein
MGQKLFMTCLLSAALPLACQLPSIVPNRDVIITPVVKKIKYCLGSTSRIGHPGDAGPSDITLYINYGLRYENHLPSSIIVPVMNRTFVRVSVAGGGKGHVVSYEDSYDARELAKMASPERRYFSVMQPGATDEHDVAPVEVRLTSPVEPLLGKTIEITVLRDHNFLMDDVIMLDKQPKWRKYGTLWRGTQESEPLKIEIPKSPATVNCMGPLD